MSTRTRRTTRRVAAVAFAVAGALATPMTPADANQADERSLVSIRNATADYRAFANSQQDGFTVLVENQTTHETCISNGAAGAMGQHYANGARVGDGVIQKQRPEVLLYTPQANGTKVLTGVEYVVLAADWLAQHDGPPVLFGKQFDLVTANPFGLPPFYALHAWAWQANPSGSFSAWNPTVSCP